LFRVGKGLELPHFVETPSRRWAWLSGDLGMLSHVFPELYQNKNTSKYAAFRPLLSHGHYTIMVMKVVMKILNHNGFDKFAYHFGFKNPAQMAILFNGFSTHICGNFILNFVLPILYYEAVSAFRKYADTNGLQENKSNSLKMLEWMEDSQEDQQFNNMIGLLKLVESYSLVMTGMRNESFKLINAGRKTLLSATILLRHDIYSRAVLRDIAENYLIDPAIKAQKEYLSLLNGQGLDFSTEEYIKRFKSLESSSTQTGIKIAAMMLNDVSDIRFKLWNQMGKNIPDNDRHQRMPLMLDERIKSCIGDINVLNIFKKVPGRTKITTLDGKHLLDETTGTQHLLNNSTVVRDVAKTEHFPQFPKRAPLRKVDRKPPTLTRSQSADMPITNAVDTDAPYIFEQEETSFAVDDVPELFQAWYAAEVQEITLRNNDTWILNENID
jgi:hypothetical protein